MKLKIIVSAIVPLFTHPALSQSFINHEAAAGLMRKAVPPESRCNINGMGNPFCNLTIGDAEMDVWVDGASIEAQAKYRPAPQGDEATNEKIVSTFHTLPMQLGFTYEEFYQLLMTAKPLQKSLIGINWEAASAVVHKDYIFRFGTLYEAPYWIWKEQIIINTAF